MFFQPAILALILAGALGVGALACAAPLAWQLVRHWDPTSGSRRQIVLERRTSLLSVVVSFVLVTQMAALLLFVFNAARMAPQFVGAMCAVGTLRVNAWGFPALLAEIAVFFAAGLWLVVDHADRLSRHSPLVRLKYALLLGLLPVVAGSFALQINYFAGLRADVITSCCGSLFSSEASTVTGEIAALPVGPARIAFFATTGAALLASSVCALRRRGALWAGLTSLLAFPAALAGVVSFLAPAVYEQPTHHCPFCLLDASWSHQGYALYVPLFAATLAGLGAAIVERFARRPGLAEEAPGLAARLAGWAAVGFGAFLAVAGVMLWRSGLVLGE